MRYRDEDHLDLYVSSVLDRDLPDKPREHIPIEEIENLSPEDLLTYAKRASEGWLDMYEAAIVFRKQSIRFGNGYNEVVRTMDEVLMEESEKIQEFLETKLEEIMDFATGWNRGRDEDGEPNWKSSYG